MPITKPKIAAIIAILGLVLIFIFGKGFYSPTAQPKTPKNESQQTGVKVVSTNPPSLDGATVSPTQDIEINFNKPMVRDRTRIIIEPETEFNFDLSPDHKTIKIMPQFKLGSNYTLTIKSGYDTDTNEKLDHDETFHFETISYNGV